MAERAPGLTPGLPLCRLEEIEDGEGKGFVLGEGSDRREIVVVREGSRVYGYVNSCPHVGTPLELQPDRFMSADGSYILCRTHGALFEIETGRCIAGPCAGQSLTPVELEL
ncbi:MAG: Rieske 2Fe-2S domain-containing protein, partial [Tistlia sp.]